MTSVTVGSDVYGAVRKVGTTPIVTKFAMFQFLPVFPIESYYLALDCMVPNRGLEFP